MKTDNPLPRIGIVGPCTSGKTTLINNLRQLDLRVDLRHIAQEHSYVQTMWKVIAKPDWLIYLDVSYPVSLTRKNLNWTEADYLEQIRRLQHARQHADFYILTDSLTPQQVTEKVKTFLTNLSNSINAPLP